MNRNTDSVNILTVCLQRANTFGHHCFGFNVAAVRGDFDGIAMRDTELIRQLLANFHKLFRLGDGVKQRMLGPVVEVLGQTISGTDIREFICFTQCFFVAFKDARGRVRDNVRVQRVSAERRFKRLVVFRERPFCHLIDSKQASHPFRLHDERPDVAARCGGTVVRNIHPAPFRAIPFQDLTFWIPRIPLRVCGSTVIKNAAVKRPCPGPTQRIAKARRVGVIATGHHVAFRRPATGKNPAAAGGRAVIAQLSE